MSPSQVALRPAITAHSTAVHFTNRFYSESFYNSFLIYGFCEPNHRREVIELPMRIYVTSWLIYFRQNYHPLPYLIKIWSICASIVAKRKKGEVLIDQKFEEIKRQDKGETIPKVADDFDLGWVIIGSYDKCINVTMKKACVSGIKVYLFQDLFYS